MNRVESMAISPDGRLIATANLHDPVTLWDAATGQVVRRLGQSPARRPGYSYEIQALAFSADGSTLAVGRPGRVIRRGELRPLVRPTGKIERWEVATGRPLPAFVGHDEPVVGIAYAADGSMMITADRSGLILIRDPSTGTVRRPFNATDQCGRLTSIALSTDGSLLVTGGAGRPLTLWDTLSGTIVRELACAGSSSSDWKRVALTLDGATVAALGGSGVEVWDARTGLHWLSIGPKTRAVDGPDRPVDLRHSFRALAITPTAGGWRREVGTQRS